MTEGRPHRTNPWRTQPGVITWSELAAGLYRHARSLGKPPEAAEDLVHDALLVYTRDPSWYDPQRGPLLRVLKVVITNRVRDQHRAKMRHSKLNSHLRLVAQPGSGPEDGVEQKQAADRREEFLGRLTAGEFALFQAWASQQRRELEGPAAAASLQMTYAEYEAAKKRLRRRCRNLLTEMNIRIGDLFDPENGAP